jgi:hypothetical protein
MRAIPLILTLALAGTVVAEVVSSDEALLSIVSHRSNSLVRVTDKPHGMQPPVVVACAAFGTNITWSIGKPDACPTPQPPTPVVVNPHGGKYYHVYVSKEGLPILKEGKGTYPVGAIVLKEKFSDETAKTTELFTAMVKREKGFNPEAGDWEYFVISGDTKKIEQRGKIESCINCHESYQSTDYVTRDYMEKP